MPNLEEQGTEIRALSNAKPVTVFEKLADKIRVAVPPWNGGADREVSLFEVLKYPDAFEISELRVVHDPHLAPRWSSGEFYLLDKGEMK